MEALMRAELLKCLAAGIGSLLASCAFITVYVYFPEKEVKQAYQALDETYLTEGSPDKPREERTPPGTAPQPAAVPAAPAGGPRQ
jgi:hypothetical protein